MASAGVQFVGVDAHPGMLEHLARRLPGTELIRAPIEGLRLQRDFDLVMVPSNILFTIDRLRGAVNHVSSRGRLAFELANPHWLRAGAGDGVRVRRLDGNEARLEIDYVLPDRTYTQVADISLVWPEEVDRWLEAGGLSLERMFGTPDLDLGSSPTYYVVARAQARLELSVDDGG